ncbi:hypothetical protein GmRootA79_16570 [Acidovorax sp. A79]|uniref:hypothetical protein n=1 Tax=Acidovorax sp. A79 TaxID=3056107 RepID=UPI0034E8E973
MNGVVYDPPRAGLPYLAVVLDNNGEVVVARSVPSVAAGEALIQQTFAAFAADRGLNVQVK